jgi:hypothetical protein
VTTERRTFPFQVEAREAEDGFNFDGLASVYDSTADLGPFRERVADTAFNKTLKDEADVRLLVNHDGVPLARTKSGTLELRSTSVGLRATTPEGRPLDLQNPTVQEVASAMRRGDLDQMSFAFQTVKDEWDDEPEDGGSPIRTIREAKLFDVSVVTYPAYEDTTAELRSQAQAVLEARTTATEPHPEPDESTSTEAAPAHSDEALRTRVRNGNAAALAALIR